MDLKLIMRGVCCAVLVLLSGVPVAGAEQAGAVALHVDTGGRVAAAGTPVSGGVPFPRGAVATVDHLKLETVQGGEVPANYWKLASWPDGSVKSALVSFVPAPSGDSYAELVLRYGPSVSHAASGPVRVAQDDGTLTITTDVLKLQISKSRFSVLEQAWTDTNGDGSFGSGEQWLTSPADLVVTDRKTGAAFRGSLWAAAEGYAPKLIEVGPRKAVVLLDGRLKGEGGAKTADGDATLAQAKVWLTVYAGSSVVELQTTLIDTKSRPTETFSDRILKLSRVAVDMPLGLPDPAYAFGGEAGAVYQGQVGSGAHLLQDGTATFSTQFSYTFAYSGAGTGAKAPGWMDVSAGGRGIMTGLRHFWQGYPHKLAMTGGGMLQLEFLPDDSPNYFYTVYPGVGKSYHAFLDLHSGSYSSVVRQRAELLLTQPLLIAEPVWYAQTEAFGPLSARSNLSAAWELRVENQYKCTALRQGCSIYPLPYGQRDFGDYQQGFGTKSTGGYFPNYGDGHYEDAHGFLLQFVRTGERKWFDFAEPSAQHHYDLDVMHTQNPPRYPGYPAGMIHWHGTSEHEGVNIEMGHVVPGGLDEYYLLTGDPRAVEVIQEQGNWMEHWARIGRGRIAPEKSGDSVGLEEYERVGAWTLYTLLKAYEVTADPKYWEAASILVKNMIDWWKMPQEHIVFDGRTLDLTRPPQEQAVFYERSDWAQGNGYPLPTLRVANCPQTSASISNYPYQSHAAIAWMSGLLQTALIRYYQELEAQGGTFQQSVIYRGGQSAISVDTATMREMFIQMTKHLVDFNYLGAPTYPSRYPWLKDLGYEFFTYSVCPGRDPKSTDGGLYLQWPLLFVSGFDQSDVSSRWQANWPQLRDKFRAIAWRQFQKFVINKPNALTGYNGVPDLWNEPYAVALMEQVGLLGSGEPVPTPTPEPSPTPEPTPTPEPEPTPTPSPAPGSDTSLPPYQVIINDGGLFISDPAVDVKIIAPSGASEINLSPVGLGQGTWQAIDQVHSLGLPPGPGVKTLYAQFRGSDGVVLASLERSVVLIEAGFAGELTLTLNDAQDAHVFSNKADLNYGGQTGVVFGRYDTGYDYWGLLRFQIPDLPAGMSVAVKAADLSVYLVDNTRNTSQVITPFRAAGDWSENAVTWNKRPTLSASSIGGGVSFTGRAEVNRWKTFPLDPAVVETWFQDPVAEAQGVVLKGEGAPGITSVSVLSSESIRPSEDRRPKLSVRVALSMTDAAPPVISGLQVTGIGETAATVQWTTDEAADGAVEYGTSTAYGQSAPLHVERSTAHAVLLEGLAGRTTYHARVISRDASGNAATSADVAFTTTGPIPGDLNRDGQLTAADVAPLVAQLLNLTPATMDTADVNQDGRLTVADVQTLVNRL